MGLADFIAQKYTLTKRNNPKFDQLKLSGMDFRTSSYDIEGIGNLGVMICSGMFGLMKMDTIIINPFEIDAPMLSIDRVRVAGKDKLYLELYDTTVSHQFHNDGLTEIATKYSHIDDIPQSEHWYDYLRIQPCLFKEAKKKTSENKTIISEYLSAYMDSLNQYSKVDRSEKIKQAKKYTDGLAEFGGPATDPMIKKYGNEFVREFFEKVLFGC